MIVQDEIVNALQKLMQKYKIKSHPRYNLLMFRSYKMC